MQYGARSLNEGGFQVNPPFEFALPCDTKPHVKTKYELLHRSAVNNSRGEEIPAIA